MPQYKYINLQVNQLKAATIKFYKSHFKVINIYYK